MQKSKVNQQRTESLMPNGIPRYLRIYDFGKDQLDRYTIVFSKLGAKYNYPYVSASETGAGVYMHDNSNYRYIDTPTYSHLGKKVKFTDLTKELQAMIIADYKDYWNIKS